MSPTLIAQQQKVFQPRKVNGIFDQFESKRVIISESQDQDILNSYQALLQYYPQWNNHIALVFLSNRTYQEVDKNVHYFEKESYDKLILTAAVRIIKSNDQLFALMDSESNKVTVNDISNYTNMAKLLHTTLVSYFKGKKNKGRHFFLLGIIKIIITYKNSCPFFFIFFSFYLF